MKNTAPSADKSAVAGPELEPGENIVALFRPDLSADLRFAESLVVVTTRRVWFRDEHGRGGELLRDRAIDVQRREHAGVCELWLSSEGAKSLRFRYTLAQARAAAELSEALGRRAGGPRPSED